MVKKIKGILSSRALIRFYRVTGFGVLSVVLVELLNLVPQLALSDQYQAIITLILTAVIAGIDKNNRELKAK